MSHQIRHFDKWGFNLFVTLLKLGYAFKFRFRSTSNQQAKPLPFGIWTLCVLDPLGLGPFNFWTLRFWPLEFWTLKVLDPWNFGPLKF